MKPAQLAKHLGAKNVAAVANAYGMAQSQLNRIFSADQPRFERMVKAYVLASKMGIKCQNLEVLIQDLSGSMNGTNAATYFFEDGTLKSDLTKFYVEDFKARMEYMCHLITSDDSVKSEFSDVLGLSLTK